MNASRLLARTAIVALAMAIQATGTSQTASAQTVHVKPPAPLPEKVLKPVKKSSTSPAQIETQRYLRNAPRVEARLARPDCSPPPDNYHAPLVVGQFTRAPGGMALGTISAYAVLPDRTTTARVRETRRTASLVQFQVFDEELGSHTPFAYTVVMRDASGRTIASTRVPIHWFWVPRITPVTTPSEARLTRDPDGSIRAQLPGLHFQQVSRIAFRLMRNGQSGSITSTGGESHGTNVFGPFNYQTQLDVIFLPTSGAWRDSDPATWYGEIDITARAPQATTCNKRGRPPSSNPTQLVRTHMAHASLRIPYEATIRPTLRTLPRSPLSKKSQQAVKTSSYTAVQKKQIQRLTTLPQVEATLARADCSAVSNTAVLVRGQVTRPRGGVALGPISANAVYPDSSIRIGVRETRRTDNLVEFELTDPTLGSRGGGFLLPSAYTVVVHDAADSRAILSTRVPIHWRWTPGLALASPGSAVRLSRDSSGNIRVHLPTILFSQVRDRNFILRRSGSSGELTTIAVADVSSNFHSIGNLAFQTDSDVTFTPTSSAWRDGNPADWSGTIEITVTAPATSCTDGRQPSNHLTLAYSRSAAPAPSPYTGQWYRVRCNCHNASGVWAVVTIKTCQIEGRDLLGTCGGAATLMQLRHPDGDWVHYSCPFLGAEPHPEDTSSCIPDPRITHIESDGLDSDSE